MVANGNDTNRWEQLLNDLDEKLQLGLLERLRRVSDYHFEGNNLTVVTANPDDYDYLSKSTVKTQLQIFAADACKINSVEIKKPS